MNLSTPFAFYSILFLKALILIGVILFVGIGLGPDEAQYWTWSQQLSPGYYSKPPGIAWQIWSGTQLFGNTELGVRFGSVVLGVLLALAVYRTARACDLPPQTARAAGIAFALSPIGILSSFLAITDGGIALFWTLATASIAHSLTQEKSPNYLYVGLWILCGALFKWPIYWFWGLVVLLIPVFPLLASRQLILGMFISLLGLLPSLYWNQAHDWVTFRHVWTTVTGGHAQETGTVALAKGNLGEFLGAQVLLVSPVLFGIAVWAYVLAIRRLRGVSGGIAFCALSTLSTLAVYLVLSCMMKMQGNWCSFIYPTAFVLIAWYAYQENHLRWLWGGVALSLALCIFAFAIPSLNLPFRLNPFKHDLGWNEFAEVLPEAGYNPKDHFLFSDKYQTTSILSFYGPEQKRAYFFNLEGARLNQFSFWPGMPAEQLDKTGYFVVVENAPHLAHFNFDFFEEKLRPYFKTVTFAGFYPLYSQNGKTLKAVALYRCEEYNGREPPSPHKY